jgi:thiosulfate reductase cytochrome b subunit
MAARHSRTVRVTHWVHAASFVALAVSGVAILIAHPRFYWGEDGYFDTPAAFELPLKVNLDQTGWGRNIHFLSAWIAVLDGMIYAAWGIASGHFRRMSAYSSYQKAVYRGVVFGLFPLVTLTGLTMSPAVTAAWPVLFQIFGGRQSARTIHFFAADLLVIFLAIHVAMTIRTGFAENVRAMTVPVK